MVVYSAIANFCSCTLTIVAARELKIACNAWSSWPNDVSADGERRVSRGVGSATAIFVDEGKSFFFLPG